MAYKVSLNDSPKDIIIGMCEGNPGGLRVSMQIFGSDPVHGLMRLLDLDDMNIRGARIWIGYKDHCGEDLEKFIECIKSRDPEMVKTINASGGREGGQLAVCHGASFD